MPHICSIGYLMPTPAGVEHSEVPTARCCCSGNVCFCSGQPRMSEYLSLLRQRLRHQTRMILLLVPTYPTYLLLLVPAYPAYCCPCSNILALLSAQQQAAPPAPRTPIPVLSISPAVRHTQAASWCAMPGLHHEHKHAHYQSTQCTTEPGTCGTFVLC